jgi:NTP pyrophosphatase (non-canonical NTP hydrolase)
VKLNKENRKKCGKVIKVYPKKHQLLLAMEESGEFIQAISKYLRYGDMEPILEEYADMEVMLEQVRKLLGIRKKEVNRRCAKKLYRALEGKVAYGNMESDS